MRGKWVEIEFDCRPLRTVTRLDVPVDASPKYEQFVLRVKAAIEKHGMMNTYYLYAASCTYHLTNDPLRGMVRFAFEGTVLTDQNDRHAKQSDLIVTLEKETCSWLSEPMVEYLSESVRQAVLVEFDSYIEAGDLQQAEERIQRLQAESDEAGGFVGMYL
ncbi:hypothetical protein FF011L_40520 [Roseimaritima multifibrata]|uniref:Uncharacterized protein n=1 Tax=Roseimaritima multifibrata TaxID=1930274 RepID=A0A517MK39_9BACT|nr:hypothetical protein [Roseimaritima multifibrata]QDS95259.1 hypothetical protein FF011L_40520 [Roseimaritima multifibrata]